MLAQEIVSLVASKQKEKINVTISGLVGWNDEHEDKRRRVILILADLCHETEIRYVDHTNIDPLKLLNRSHVHLNRSGDIIFEQNLFNACKNWFGRLGCSGRHGENKSKEEKLDNNLSDLCHNYVSPPHEPDRPMILIMRYFMKALTTANLMMMMQLPPWKILDVKNGLIIPYLNINSVRNKIEFLRPLVSDYVDVLIIAETIIENAFVKYRGLEISQ